MTLKTPILCPIHLRVVIHFITLPLHVGWEVVSRRISSSGIHADLCYWTTHMQDMRDSTKMASQSSGCVVHGGLLMTDAMGSKSSAAAAAAAGHRQWHTSS
jgi:hypothetical protein